MATRGKTRKGPRVHASETELGRVTYVKGVPWIVEAAGKSRRWNKATGFFTLDNGGRPFYVKVRDGSIQVMKGRCADESDWCDMIYDKLVYSIPKYEKLWVGANKGKYAKKYAPVDEGNSLLVHVAGTDYVYIGDRVHKFTTTDIIREFHGVIGNSDVVYAFAIGDDFMYFFVDNGGSMPKELFKDGGDPYQTYFQNKKHLKLNGKIVVERIF